MFKIIFATFVLFAAPAFAQDAFYGSVKLGMGDMTGHPQIDTDPELTYGANFGVLFNDFVAFGVNFNYFKAEFPDAIIGDVDFSAAVYMAELTFYFMPPTDKHSPYAGILLGAATTKEVVGAGLEVSSSDAAAGAKLGFNFSVAPDFSIAPEFNYTLIMTDNDDLSLIGGQLVVTAWF